MDEGKLFVVATPIGNLADITLRAESALAEVSLIASEDTRVTRKLLAHLGITTPLIRADEEAIPRALQRVLTELSAGRDVALVSDAGTPGLSDPGPRLVAGVVSAGFEVVPLPGPSALAAALSVCHFPAQPFIFIGFLPKKKGERERLLSGVADFAGALALFVPARELGRVLSELAGVLGEGRQALVAREISKLHQEYLRGTLGELAERAGEREFKGEATLIVAPPVSAPKAKLPPKDELRAQVLEFMREGLTKKEAYSALAKRYGVPRREIYNLLEGGG